MAFQQKPNSGALFGNKKKKSEGSPNMTGNATAIIVCPHCGKGESHRLELAAWKKIIQAGDNAGDAFLSLKLTPPSEAPQQQVAQPLQEPDEDDDIPW